MTLGDAVGASARALEENADELGRLDSITGDGDLGRTATRIAAALRSAVEREAAADDATLLLTCGKAIAASAPSSCGTLVATGMLAAGRCVRESRGAPSLGDALDAALAAIKRRGRASEGDRSMVDALSPGARAASDQPAGTPPPERLQAIAAALAGGAHATTDMVPRVGRARANPEKAIGTPDAGAVLVTIALGAALRSAASER